MTIICSPLLKQIVMLFNRKTELMSDREVVADLPKWLRKSEAYDEFKLATDLQVARINLIENEGTAQQAGSFLFTYLKQGYVCLGNYVGQPKPDMSHLGVKTVRRQTGVGFYL